MFFDFGEKAKGPEDTSGTQVGTEQQEQGSFNEDGSPKYLMGPEGELIINDYALLLGKEEHKEPPAPEDLASTLKFVLGQWFPLSAFREWA